MKNGQVMVKIKKVSTEAFPLEYKSEGAAGFDFTSIEEVTLQPGEIKLIKTGWSFELPEGSELQVRPRSGLSLKEGLEAILGTVDSDYRGEVGIILKNSSYYNKVVTKGMRIAQGVIASVSKAFFVDCKELSNTTRGEGGFGSTGK